VAPSVDDEDGYDVELEDGYAVELDVLDDG
jgi:hypothetical protein